MGSWIGHESLFCFFYLKRGCFFFFFNVERGILSKEGQLSPRTLNKVSLNVFLFLFFGMNVPSVHRAVPETRSSSCGFSDAQIVQWSPSGEKYIVAVNDKLDIYELESASVVGTFSYRKRISSVRFLKVCFMFLPFLLLSLLLYTYFTYYVLN